MRCSKCNKKIDFVGQIKEWDEMYGNQAALDPNFPIMINLICEHCNESSAVVYIEVTIDDEEIDCQATGDKVHIPLTKSTIKVAKNKKKK